MNSSVPHDSAPAVIAAVIVLFMILALAVMAGAAAFRALGRYLFRRR